MLVCAMLGLCWMLLPRAVKAIEGAARQPHREVTGVACEGAGYLMTGIVVMGSLWVGCGGGSNTGNTDGGTDGGNKNCTHEFVCQNDVCACGSDGSGAACADPDDTEAAASDKCDSKCEVCS